jgi:hypothetical protein
MMREMKTDAPLRGSVKRSTLINWEINWKGHLNASLYVLSPIPNSLLWGLLMLHSQSQVFVSDSLCVEECKWREFLEESGTRRCLQSLCLQTRKYADSLGHTCTPCWTTRTVVVDMQTKQLFHHQTLKAEETLWWTSAGEIKRRRNFYSKWMKTISWTKTDFQLDYKILHNSFNKTTSPSRPPRKSTRIFIQSIFLIKDVLWHLKTNISKQLVIVGRVYRLYTVLGTRTDYLAIDC